MMDSNFKKHGYALFPGVLTRDAIEMIRKALGAEEACENDHARHGQVYALRDVFASHKDLLALASQGPLLTLARQLAGPGAHPTKATFFDKRPEANWTLPLHQDLTITVNQQADLPGYTHWSTKADVPHVQPPVEILESIVALRIHLDDCPVENGALEVVPGSHLRGRISPADLRAMHVNGEVVPCPAGAGDVLAMRPLLVHGSRKALVPKRRRVLHIEYAAVDLEPPLRWPMWGD